MQYRDSKKKNKKIGKMMVRWKGCSIVLIKVLEVENKIVKKLLKR